MDSPSSKQELARELRAVASFKEAVAACLKAADFLDGAAPEPSGSLDKAAQALRECMESGYGLVVEMVDALRLVRIMVREGNLGAAQPPSATQWDATYQPAMVFAVRELLDSLPKSRDWFNPDAERIFREFLSDAKQRLPLTKPAARCPDCGHDRPQDCLHEPGWKPDETSVRRCFGCTVSERVAKLSRAKSGVLVCDDCRTRGDL